MKIIPITLEKQKLFDLDEAFIGFIAKHFDYRAVFERRMKQKHRYYISHSGTKAKQEKIIKLWCAEKKGNSGSLMPCGYDKYTFGRAYSACLYPAEEAQK